MKRRSSRRVAIAWTCLCLVSVGIAFARAREGGAGSGGSGTSLDPASASSAGYLNRVGSQLIIDAGLTIIGESDNYDGGDPGTYALTLRSADGGFTNGIRISSPQGGSIAINTGTYDWIMASIYGNSDLHFGLYVPGSNSFLDILLLSYTSGKVDSPYGFSARPAGAGVAFASSTANKWCPGSASTGCFTYSATAPTVESVLFTTGIGLGAAINWSPTAPTVPVACTTPTITHGTATSFQADVGGTCTGVSTFAVTLPAAANGWHCHGENISAAATRVLAMTANSTTSATMTNFSRTLGTAADFADGADLIISCTAR